MGSRDRDEESGKFTETYPPRDFLNALEELNSAGTSEIAESVGCDRRTAYLKLQSLEEEGKVQSRKVGNALLWKLPE
ncbi:transcriptional regulator [Natronomonas sp. CBA1123]|jgi:predicted transcriptional regulator|uniref:transcriptional regulator n=1 Tax=Natronomonas sp. CBA1123 TaxID=2668070 RepID=UPI0012EAD0FF|nr:transcriptional regulator [Natronomonas sp. CBA1123]MUV85329.1 transcriptional regulator [Natronomonas sp. CBA1123]